MEPGVYEQLLTERLYQVLEANEAQVAALQDVDEAEQPLAITRHLARLIERALRAAQTPESRIAMVRDIVSALPDADFLDEVLYKQERYKALNGH